MIYWTQWNMMLSNCKPCHWSLSVFSQWCHSCNGATDTTFTTMQKWQLIIFPPFNIQLTSWVVLMQYIIYRDLPVMFPLCLVSQGGQVTYINYNCYLQLLQLSKNSTKLNRAQCGNNMYLMIYLSMEQSALPPSLTISHSVIEDNCM